MPCGEEGVVAGGEGGECEGEGERGGKGLENAAAGLGWSIKTADEGGGRGVRG